VLYIGLMSGTSMDGIDAALVEFIDDEQKLIGYTSIPWPTELAERLRALSIPGNNEIERLGHLDVEVANHFAAGTLDLLNKCGIEPAGVRAIGSHGQTVRHRPTGLLPFTLQIGDPNRLSEQTGITVVADFRRRDMAAGGQGAPLVPAYHASFLSSRNEERVVLNIGGIANITHLPAGNKNCVVGFDTGPGNTLLDGWATRHLGKPYDKDGEWAAGGQPVPELLHRLRGAPYFQQPYPKSTGPEQFNLTWLDQHLERSQYSPQDVQATLSQLTAGSIADAIRTHCPGCGRVIVCGGGAHNRELMRQLTLALGHIDLRSSSAYGIDPDHMEAMAFAWLARQTMKGLSGNLPAVTGASHEAILGGIYPGGPLTMLGLRGR